MWIEKARLPCWPPRGQVLHQRWIWGIHCSQAWKHTSEGSTLALKPRAGETSPEVQNKGISGPKKKDSCSPKNVLKQINKASRGGWVDSVSAYYVGGLSIESRQPTSVTNVACRERDRPPCHIHAYTVYTPIGGKGRCCTRCDLQDHSTQARKSAGKSAGEISTLDLKLMRKDTRSPKQEQSVAPQNGPWSRQKKILKNFKKN